MDLLDLCRDIDGKTIDEPEKTREKPETVSEAIDRSVATGDPVQITGRDSGYTPVVLPETTEIDDPGFDIDFVASQYTTDHTKFDLVEITFHSKPDRDICQSLKRFCFRYLPDRRVWRQVNSREIREVITRILGVSFDNESERFDSGDSPEVDLSTVDPLKFSDTFNRYVDQMNFLSDKWGVSLTEAYLKAIHLTAELERE